MVLAAAALLAAAVADSCSTPGAVVAPLEIPGAHYVGNQVCEQCHGTIVREFAANPHAHLVLRNVKVPGGVGCESCHGPGSRHAAAGGGRGRFIINPGRKPEACFRCHLQVHAEFQLPVHHPVIEGRMSCSQCHDPHGGDIYKPLRPGSESAMPNPSSVLAMAQRDESCAQCHRQQTRPFAFEHPALREGCTTCHNPHGSINRMLLTQADDNLCLRCHAQVQTTPGQIYIGNVDHTSFLQQGACWSCHTAIHGSDLDPRLRF